MCVRARERETVARTGTEQQMSPSISVSVGHACGITYTYVVMWSETDVVGVEGLLDGYLIGRVLQFAKGNGPSRVSRPNFGT